MKILDRYLLKSFTMTFASVFVILFFIFILQTVWLFITELAGKDLDLILVSKFLLFAMPRIIPLVLPLSVLLASIMTFGSFAENYEFAAMKSSGISLQRAMRVLTIFMIILSIGAFFFANNVIPFAEYKFINFRKDIAQMKPSMAIAEGQFNDVGIYNIKVNKKSGKDGRLLTGITIHKKTNSFDGTKNVIKAKNGELMSKDNSNILQLVLNDGYYYEDLTPKKFEEKQKLPFAKSSFKKYVINLDLSKLNKTSDANFEISNTNTMMNVRELKYTLDSLNKSYAKDVRSFADNTYQRTGIATLRPIVKSDGKLRADLLSGYNAAEKKDILNNASNNLQGSKYSIESSKVEFENKVKNINVHWITFFDKFVVAYACLVMFFIGAPLGAIIRKGGVGLPIVFAVLIFIAYNFINTFGRKLASENGIPPVLGSWLSSFILTPFAVLVTYRATNDISFTVDFTRITAPIQRLFQSSAIDAAETEAEVKTARLLKAYQRSALISLFACSALIVLGIVLAIKWQPAVFVIAIAAAIVLYINVHYAQRHLISIIGGDVEPAWLATAGAIPFFFLIYISNNAALKNSGLDIENLQRLASEKAMARRNLDKSVIGPGMPLTAYRKFSVIAMILYLAVMAAGIVLIFKWKLPLLISGIFIAVLLYVFVYKAQRNLRHIVIDAEPAWIAAACAIPFYFLVYFSNMSAQSAALKQKN